MKTHTLKIAFALTIGLMTSFNSCERDSKMKSACGVENPTTNIPWLKEYINSMSNSATSELTNINYYRYNSENIIEIKWRNIGILDVPTGQLFNCNGVELYPCGGNQPIDSCMIVLKASELISSLWEKK
jgi:hypothetical protein